MNMFQTYIVATPNVPQPIPIPATEEYYDDQTNKGNKDEGKKQNILPIWGNEKTMNLNPLILTNIQSSHYFKVNLYELKTYHEVIDEIYYNVKHLEPWEKGSRNTAGQTGMCGGVRGVGAGGIVSTAYCILYKLFTLKLTRKQVTGLLNHNDSPYIRGLGFMYIRYTQPPSDLWEWYEDYLDDEEEIDVKAGGGHCVTIGEMLKHFLTKLEWFSSLFPRIPVPLQKDFEKKLGDRYPQKNKIQRGSNPRSAAPQPPQPVKEARHIPDEEVSWGEAERISRLRRSSSYEKRNPGNGEKPKERGRSKSKSRERERHNRVHSRDAYKEERDRDRYRKRETGHDVSRRERDREHKRKSRSRERDRDRHRHHKSRKHKSRSRSPHKSRDRY